jgi:putative exporter of polyketide antibiotics
MLRRFLTIVLAVLVLAVVVPLGAALTLDRRLPVGTGAFPRVSAAPSRTAASQPLSEAAALALTGTVLISLGVAVRRVP